MLLTSSKKGLLVDFLTLVWRAWLLAVTLTTGDMFEPDKLRPYITRTRTCHDRMYKSKIGCAKELPGFARDLPASEQMTSMRPPYRSSKSVHLVLRR